VASETIFPSALILDGQRQRHEAVAVNHSRAVEVLDVVGVLRDHRALAFI
jgi:hypothetical protein